MRLKQFRSKLFRFRFSEKFRSFRIPLAISTSERGSENGKRNFVLPSGGEFIESCCLARAINLNPLQRLNEAHPEHSFHSLVVRHRMNPPGRTWRLRNVGAEAV